jgi:hypothetical protein
MKKPILIIVILSIAALCFAGPLQEMHKRVIAGSTVAAGADVTAPEVSGNPVIDTDGDTVTITFTEAVVTTGYDTGDFDIDCDGASGANNNLSYTSGSGSSSVVFATTSTVQSGETCNLDYTGGADEIEDTSGNDLATFSDDAMTNNSTQGAGGPDTWYYSEGLTETDYQDSVTSSGWAHSTYVYGDSITVTTGGTATDMAVFIVDYGDGTADVKLGLYDSSDNLLAECTSTDIGTTPGGAWEGCDSPISQSVSGSTTYKVFVSVSVDDVGINIDNTGTKEYDTCSYASAFSSCDPLSTSSESNTVGVRLYVD